MAHDATAPAPPVAPVPLWRNRDYLLLWSGQMVSDTGTRVSQIAFPLLVLALTGSPAQAGFVAAARTVPYLLFTLPAGALVDRWNRKLTMIVCNAGSAVALASVAVAYALNSLTITQIVVVSFVEGTFGVFFGLAETSALPQVVHRSQLATAVAQQEVQYSLGGIIGPTFGGTLYSASPLLPFAVDAASYGASASSLATVRTRFQATREAVRRSLRAEMTEGVVWLWHQPLMRTMAALMGGLNFATAGGTLILIVLLQQQGASPALTGTIFALGSVGGIFGAFLAPQLQRRLTFGQAIIGMSWFFALIYGAFAVASTPMLVAAVFFVSYVFGPTYNTVQMSYRLALIPDALQGRVNSVYRLVVQGVNPLGLALTGVLLERVGGVTTLLIFSGILAAVAALTTLNRKVRDAPRVTHAQPTA